MIPPGDISAEDFVDSLLASGPVTTSRVPIGNLETTAIPLNMGRSYRHSLVESMLHIEVSPNSALSSRQGSDTKLRFFNSRWVSRDLIS